MGAIAGAESFPEPPLLPATPPPLPPHRGDWQRRDDGRIGLLRHQRRRRRCLDRLHTDRVVVLTPPPPLKFEYYFQELPYVTRREGT